MGPSTWLGSAIRRFLNKYKPLLLTFHQRSTRSAVYREIRSESRRAPPVTKSGIQEHLLAIITTCDLVSLRLSSYRDYLWTFSAVPIRRTSCHSGFITYINHKLRDDDILHKSSLAGAVNEKVIQLEEQTLSIVKVRYSCLNRR